MDQLRSVAAFAGKLGGNNQNTIPKKKRSLFNFIVEESATPVYCTLKIELSPSRRLSVTQQNLVCLRFFPLINRPGTQVRFTRAASLRPRKQVPNDSCSRYLEKKKKCYVTLVAHAQLVI